MDTQQMLDFSTGLAAAKQEHEDFKRRLDEHDRKLDMLYDLTLAIQKQGDTLEAFGKTLTSVKSAVDNVVSRVSDIEREPADKAKKIAFEIVKYVVLAVVGAAVGYFLK